MHAIASTLTDEQMRNLAAYYARGAGENLATSK